MRSLRVLVLLALAGCGGEAPAPDTPLSSQDQVVLARAVQSYRDGRPQDVGPELAPLLARRPPPVDAQAIAGEAAYASDLYAEAVERLTDAVARRPALLGTATSLGFAHWKLGQFAEAAAVFRQITALRPDSYKAHYGLGLVALSEGRLPDARVALEEALRLRPDYIKARFQMGRLQQEEGHLEEAAVTLAAVVTQWPAQDEALLRLAQVQAALGRKAEAAATLTQRLKVHAVREELAGLQAASRAEGETAGQRARMIELLREVGEDEEAAQALADGARRFPGAPEVQRLTAGKAAEAPRH